MASSISAKTGVAAACVARPLAGEAHRQRSRQSDVAISKVVVVARRDQCDGRRHLCGNPGRILPSPAIREGSRPAEYPPAKSPPTEASEGWVLDAPTATATYHRHRCRYATCRGVEPSGEANCRQASGILSRSRGRTDILMQLLLKRTCGGAVAGAFERR